MKYQDALKRLESAQVILADSSITLDKFQALQKLVSGLHPKLDRLMTLCVKEWQRFGHIEKGEVLELILENIPDKTDQEKKRKKLLLLFLSTWKDLQKEVVRVKAEFAHSSGSQSKQSSLQSLGNILGKAKGPLGLVTVIAVGWVALSSTSVEISIQNRGCGTMYPTSYSNIPLPGISLPKRPIANGETGVVRLPPLDIFVDGKTPGRVILSAFKINYQFNIPPDVSLAFNGESLIGAKRKLRLRTSKKHNLVVQCREVATITGNLSEQ